MSQEAPGENNKKALAWVQSFEEFDNEDTVLKYDPWAGWYIQVRRGDCTNDQIGILSRRCWALFHTSLWALEWHDERVSLNPI